MELSVIPKPASVKYTRGVFKSPGIPSIIKKEGGIDGDALSGCDAPAGCAAPEEAYQLKITKKSITLQAPSPAGMFNGEQTIRQLVMSELKDGHLVLPCAEITDYPRFSWRGFMLDCSRYFYSVPFIKNLIDVLAMHHINRFHWHLTDDQGWRLPVKEFPLLADIGSKRHDSRIPARNVTGNFYTEDEIRDVVEFAASRHTEIIPEADLPGHASAILACYPGLGCTGGPYRVEDRFGIFEDVLCAGNDHIFDLAAAVFDALCGLFPSKWVHIGGDEVLFNRWKECPKCRKRQKELKLKKTGELQSWITFRLARMLADRGKTAIGWDEILEDSPKYRLPKDTVIMSWRGNKSGIRAASGAGGLAHDVIMSPNTEGCYLDYKHINVPEEPGQIYAGASSVYMSYSMDPAPASMGKEASARILGGQGNLWSEFIYAGKIAEYMIFPRICAIAETVWTPRKEKDFEDFSRRLIVHRERLDKLGVQQYRGTLR
ncbi:MAG: beta-N-acetylhexosaminidase [Treponema sp.]|jgi:hexosaminidase|nr:beta-N-acetylhexosaminidase [Treponema sp.]